MASRAEHVVEQHRRLDSLLNERDGLLSLLDRVAALHGTSELIRRATGAHAGFVADLDPTGEQAVVRWLAGNRTDALRDLVVPVGLGLGGQAAARKQPVRVSDYISAATITHHFDGPVRGEGLAAMVAVPVLDRARVLAVAYAALREPSAFGDDAVEAMQHIAGQAATALRLAERAEQRNRTAVAAERRRLQVSLHDSVGAMLFSIGAQVHDLADSAGDNPALIGRLRTLKGDVSAASAALREALFALSESTPDRALAVSVAEHCRSFENRTGVSARFLQLGAVPPMDAERCDVLVAAAREGLLNVEKHARAGSVVVSIGESDDGVQLAVADDGPGTGDPTGNPTGTAAPHRPGFGLATLSERAAAVGGRVSLVRDEDGGATLRVWVPTLGRLRAAGE